MSKRVRTAERLIEDKCHGTAIHIQEEYRRIVCKNTLHINNTSLLCVPPTLKSDFCSWVEVGHDIPCDTETIAETENILKFDN